MICLPPLTNNLPNAYFLDLALRQLTCNINDARHSFTQKLPDRIYVRRLLLISCLEL